MDSISVSDEKDEQFTAEEIERLVEVGVLLGSTLRLEEVIGIVLDQAIMVVMGEAGLLWLNMPEVTEQFEPVLGYGFDTASVQKIKELHSTFLQSICAKSRGMIIDDRTDDMRYRRLLTESGEILGYQISSILLTSLVSKGRSIGCLQIFNKQGETYFNQRDLRLCSAFSSQAAVVLENSYLFSNQEKLLLSLIKTLASALDARDHYTRGHSERVSTYSQLIAQGLEFSQAEQEALVRAALLHDVGKIGIGDDILLEPGPLNQKQWEVMRSHPAIGAQIISQVQPKSFFKQVYAGIMYHQERYDGSGYPAGLKGEEIPLVARIISIADAYDAMTSDRPYRKGKSAGEALKEIKNCAGKQFDPRLAEIFVELMEDISDC